MKGHLLWLSLLLWFCAGSGQEQPRVAVENGVVVGHLGVSPSGKSYQKFEGIPYAKPPVNGRRFKGPERLDEEWIGEWNATSPGSPCLQYDQYTKTINDDGDVVFSVLGDEDCLFLNVYISEGESKDRNVIVFIHGGAFMFGASHQYAPDYLMDNDNLVYVTMNYRLGPLGFLTTGDALAPGNNGLKDQVAALEWVQRNIAAFGGDPKKVTLAGLSAGGVSVHFHFLSPLSKGLFTKGYSYSGTTLCPWVIVSDGPQRSKQLATYLGCPTTDSKTMLKCLRRRPAVKIVAQMKNFQPWLYNPFTVFGPVVEVDSDRPFISKTPLEILKNGEAHDLPWISGYTSEDGLYPAADFIESDRFLEELDKHWNKLAPILVFFPQQPKKGSAKKIKEMYLGSEAFSKETVPQIIQMYSDRLFIAPAVKAARLQAKKNTQPVYLYQYSFKTDKSVSQGLAGTESTFGACHGDDMAYVVKLNNFETLVTEEDKAMSRMLSDILLTFAETGAPPKELKWEAVSKKSSGSVKYLHIQSPEEVNMEEGTDIGNATKWVKILGKKTAKDELMLEVAILRFCGVLDLPSRRIV